MLSKAMQCYPSKAIGPRISGIFTGPLKMFHLYIYELRYWAFNQNLLVSFHPSHQDPSDLYVYAFIQKYYSSIMIINLI